MFWILIDWVLSRFPIGNNMHSIVNNPVFATRVKDLSV